MSRKIVQATLLLIALSYVATAQFIKPTIIVRGELGEKLDRHLTSLTEKGFNGALSVCGG